MVQLNFDTIIPALFGSLVYIVIRLYNEKQRRDKDKKYSKSLPWGEYFAKSWDDFAFAVFCAFFLGQYQESIAGIIQVWQKIDFDIFWDYYFDWERFLGAVLGLFGSFIVKGFYEAGKIAIKFVMSKVQVLKGK